MYRMLTVSVILYRMLTVSVILAFVTVPAHAQKKSKDRVDPIAADQEVGATWSTYRQTVATRPYTSTTCEHAPTPGAG